MKLKLKCLLSVLIGELEFFDSFKISLLLKKTISIALKRNYVNPTLL